MEENYNEVLRVMIRMYCKTHHHPKGELCDECEDLYKYAVYRKSVCPFDKDHFCSGCKIHCFKPEYKEKIRKVMKFSGPLISFVHPIIGTKHLICMINAKKRIKAEEKAKAEKAKAKAELQKEQASKAEDKSSK